MNAPIAIAKNKGIEQIEAHMLNMPQAECPVVHRFGPGIYIREVFLKKGLIAVGHLQKKEHLNVVITGKVAMVDGDTVKEIEAPFVYTAKPGRKVGYVIEDCVWQNIYATDETDIEILESMFLDKSETYKHYQELNAEYNYLSKKDDRDDYKAMLQDHGITEDQAISQSENTYDQVKMPKEWMARLSVRSSPIHGNGLFLCSPAKAGEVIAPARINGMRTEAGRYVNHSANPNSEYRLDENGNVYLVASFDIEGCLGGSEGTELTVNYQLSLNGELKCLQ